MVGLTFPLGVLTLAVLNLGQQIHVSFIQSIAYVLAVILVMLWLLVVSRTAQGFYRGNLFFSPCLKSYLEQR